jgi:predicted AAA+ superfamily ATPase
MIWIPRKIEKVLQEAVGTRPAVLLTGARQTGKSTLFKKLYPDVPYFSFDRFLLAEEAQNNPESFLVALSMHPQVMLDEIQYAPRLFPELKLKIDQDRQSYGRWLLTGSQKFQLMHEVSESLAGRIRILHLETLSAEELRHSQLFSQAEMDLFLLKGGYPELWENPVLKPRDFFSDYVQTYLEKDLKNIVASKRLRDFQKFLLMCASRIGQILNFSDLSKELGITVPVVKAWLNALEISGVLYLLPPYYQNLGKRLIKAPKLYFADHGLAAYLLNIESPDQLSVSPFKGAFWENIVFNEIIKTTGAIPGRGLFFYRDQNGVEIDFLLEHHHRIILIEAKAQEMPRGLKLNFSKVSPLIRDKSVDSVLACSVQEDRLIHYQDYRLWNPLRCSFVM